MRSILFGLTITIGIIVLINSFSSSQNDPFNLFHESLDNPLEETAKFTQQGLVSPSCLSADLTSLYPSTLNSPHSYTPHTPIEISSDDELAATAAGGAGTALDPYLLEGWNVTSTGAHGLSIHNTTKHFIIRDCWVMTRSYFHYGIYLQHVAPGTATLVNNLCQNSTHGILLESSADSTIVNNTCRYNYYNGIRLSSSEATTVVDNSCTQNIQYGIHLEGSGSSRIANNSCSQNVWGGITLSSSANSIVAENSCDMNSGHGISEVFSENSTIANNICQRNGGHGIVGNSLNITVVNNLSEYNHINGIDFDSSPSIISDITISNNSCNHNRKKGVFLRNAEDSMVSNNICSHNREDGIVIDNARRLVIRDNICNFNSEDGIVLDSSEETIIILNFCYQNLNQGIYLHNSAASTVANNTCTYSHEHGLVLIDVKNTTVVSNLCRHNNGTGIYLLFSSDVTIKHNLCSYNKEGGIGFSNTNTCQSSKNLLLENQYYGCFLDANSTKNQFYHNSFLVNNAGAVQAADNGTNNRWYDELTQAGNYWTDYIKSGSYALAGSANATDPYPLADIFDFDADGMPDGWEYTYGLNVTDPADAHQDLDTDGMPNLWEYQMGLNITKDDAAADRDQDGLPNLWEYTMGLNATWDDAAADRDQDGLPNLWEYTMGLNATDPHDATLDLDGDGLTNIQEYKYGANPHDRDSDNDFFPDGLDYGWWGHPSRNWDNPLTRGLLLSFLLGVLVLVIWSGYIAYQLPRLQQDLRLLFRHFQQYVQQFNEHITAFQNHASLEELEAAAIHMSLTFQSYEDFYLFALQLVDCKWLPSFLRPDLTPWETLFATMQHHYEDFQQTRLERLEAKY